MMIVRRAQIAAAETARVTTIEIIGVMSTVTGALVALTAPSTAPTFVLLAQVAAWPEAIGWSLSILGVILLVSIGRDHQWVTFAALVLIGAWNLAYAATFAVTWTLWAADVNHGPPPTVYQVAMYALIAALCFIHADAVRRVAAVRKRMGASDG